MTRARQAVLSALVGAKEPLSAALVVERMNGVCDQATVYRALHYLESAGFAESFVLSCAEHGVERYYASRSAPHRHWFHCERCHRFIDMGVCKIGNLVAELEKDHELTVSRHTLYLSGTCKECAEARKSTGSHTC